jgi:DNA-binding protein YbaB
VIAGGNRVNIGQIAKMAQQMQTQMAQAQEELAETTLEATAGGGAVKIVASSGFNVDKCQTMAVARAPTGSRRNSPLGEGALD